MKPTEQDYELVAAYLDGQPVTLSAQQAELARQINADAQAARPALEVEVPAGLLHRVNAGVLKETRQTHAASRRARPLRASFSDARTSRRKWILGVLGAASAAAAAILLAVALHGPSANPRDIAVSPPTTTDGRTAAAEPSPSELNTQIALLAMELDMYRQEMTSTDLPPSDSEQALDDLLSDESLSGS